jgi:hypothetical protein
MMRRSAATIRMMMVLPKIRSMEGDSGYGRRR